MELPRNYPYGCGDQQIALMLREYADEIAASGGNVNKVLQLAPLIVIGQSELQGRQTSRVTRISFGLGVLSVVIALVALWVSIANSRTDANWQASQSEGLKTIHRDLQAGYDLQTMQLELLRSINDHLNKAEEPDKRVSRK